MKLLAKFVDFLAHVTLFADRPQRPLSFSSPSESALTAATGLNVAESPIHSAGECINGPKSRRCWTAGFDIQTDYELRWPDTGKIRQVRLQDGKPLYSAQRSSTLWYSQMSTSLLMDTTSRVCSSMGPIPVPSSRLIGEIC